MTKIEWYLPLKTISEANSSEHWTSKSKRHKQQQFFVRALFNRESRPITTPCCIKLTRLGPRYLDADDNLPMALKWIKDEIAECLFPENKKIYKDKKGKERVLKGRSDDSPLVKWEYSQEKAVICGIRIEITCEILE